MPGAILPYIVRSMLTPRHSRCCPCHVINIHGRRRTPTNNSRQRRRWRGSASNRQQCCDTVRRSLLPPAHCCVHFLSLAHKFTVPLITILSRIHPLFLLVSFTYSFVACYACFNNKIIASCLTIDNNGRVNSQLDRKCPPSL